MVAGFGVGESREQRERVMQLVTAALPPHQARFTSGVGGPVDILQAVAHGIDVIDSR